GGSSVPRSDQRVSRALADAVRDVRDRLRAALHRYAARDRSAGVPPAPRCWKRELMTWLAPGAFAALALVAGPVLVHLLAPRNARRLIFPATHFVRATQSAAVRLRRPSDIGLLLLRLAIVATAVL